MVVDQEQSQLKDQVVQAGHIPRHIAIIMDGNGRWARQKGLPRIAGHRRGIDSVREVVRATGELGVEALTLYVFSAENWRRPRREIGALMKLLQETTRQEVDDLMRNNVRLDIIGRLDEIAPAAKNVLTEAVRRTSGNTGLLLNLAINYGSRSELVDAVRRMVDNIQRGELAVGDIDEDMFGRYLYTGQLPDPDLLIRTSGEMRLSNFLLWQLAYTEIYVTDVLWPDFRREHLYRAILDYQSRERRFGGI
jgi:undecaprenyl diphosphate synthase